jgi:membrane-bound serine protease (ClpP class)
MAAPIGLRLDQRSAPYALQVVVVTALGFLLLVVGGALLVAEAHVPSTGVLGLGGVVALVVVLSGIGGGLVLALVLAAITGAAGVGLLVAVIPRAAATRRRRVRAGPEAMIGHIGITRSGSGTAGDVFVDGALWRARLAHNGDGTETLHEGDHVVVEDVRGLTLSVRKAEDWEIPK